MEQSTTTDSDPRWWTVGQVVYELCRNPSPPWSLNSQTHRILDRDLLERACVENDIDGNNLLSLDMATLKSELGVNSWGQRKVVMAAVEYYRARSANWRGTALASNSITSAPNVDETPLLPSPSSASFPHNSALLRHDPWPSREPSRGPTPPSLHLRLEPHAHTPIDKPVSGHSLHPRPTPSPQPISQRAPSATPTANSAITRDTTKQKTKRIAPTFVSAVTDGRPTESVEHSYLSKSGVPLQDLFYNKASNFGADFYRAPADDAHTFVLGGGRFSSGQRRYVARHFQYFLRHGYYPLPDTQSHVRIPYDYRHIQKPFSGAYFTLFPKEGRSRVYQADDFPQIRALQRSNPEVAPADDIHDYLLDKYPVSTSDDGLPLLGDSGDEGVYDDETWEEIEEEKAQKAQLEAKASTTKPMTPIAVAATIQEAIEDLKQEWRTTKLAKVQLKAHHLWIRAARKQTRREEISRAIYWRDRYVNMRDKIQGAIQDDVWFSAADLKRQCQNIEEAVFQVEEFDYYSQILQQSAPPEKPPPGALRARPPPKHVDLEEDEEIIESDSDLLNHDQDLDGFLDDDSSEAGSIHHVPSDGPGDPILLDAWASPGTEPGPGSAADGIQPSMSTPAPPQAPSPTLAQVSAQTPEDDADIDSDDNIISPTRRVRDVPKATPTSAAQKRSHLPAATIRDSSSDIDSPRPLTLTYRRHGRTERYPVDLTMSSPPRLGESTGEDSDYSVHTPELNPDDTITPEKGKGTMPGDWSPESRADGTTKVRLEDVPGILDMDWSQIEAAVDRRRALAKAVYESEVDAVDDLEQFLTNSIPWFDDRRGVLLGGLLDLSGDRGKIKGVKAKHQSSARLFICLFVTYVCGRHVDDYSSLPRAQRDAAYNDLDEALELFSKLLNQVIQIFVQHNSGSKQIPKKRKRAPSSEEEILEVLTDDTGHDEPPQPPQPPHSHKKRKRKVEQSAEAMKLQRSDKARIQEQEQRQKLMADRLSQSQGDETAVPPINTTEPYIYLHEHIARRVKPHQVKGIQFMWREIVEDPRHQGCILAHTMGLGKTMQVISLLITIALCSKSSDARIRDQIPTSLRTMKTLILCPASLVDNWYDELILWTPNSTVLGNVYKLDTSDWSKVFSWSKAGGIILMGYERFRTWVTATGRSRHSVDIEKILLEEPTLVVADEAHKLKAPTSGLNKCANRIKTTSRIALTGSPLNNHLEEYHTMVDWVAPGYLGNMVQYRSRYSEPISEGLYADSTPAERRLCLRRLLVLKKTLDPKIDRADISAIKKDMPAKTEYFITLPLTALQREAYNIFVKCVSMTEKERISNTRMFSWIGVLSLLLHHPRSFLVKLRERAEDLTNPGGERKQIDDGDDTRSEISASSEDLDTPENGKEDDDIVLEQTGPMGSALRQIESLFGHPSSADAIMEPDLSYRTLVTQKIIEQAATVGDKTLIFTHKLLTLNYLADMLTRMNVPFFQLEGRTKMRDRQGATKAFNQSSNCQVFLISMRAGGLGLNLQGANRVIIFDFDFNPSWEEQAIGRAYRLTQKVPVFVYRFQAGGTFEDVLFNKAVFKTQLFDRVVDQKRPTRQATKRVADYLFPVKDVNQHDFSDCMGKDPKVLDAIIDRLDCIRKMVLTETFQREDDEQLDADEQQAAEEEYQDQILRRNNPAAWEAKQAAQIAQLQRYRGAQVPPSPYSAPTIGRLQMGHQGLPPPPSGIWPALQTHSTVPPSTNPTPVRSAPIDDIALYMDSAERPQQRRRAASADRDMHFT